MLTEPLKWLRFINLLPKCFYSLVSVKSVSSMFAYRVKVTSVLGTGSGSEVRGQRSGSEVRVRGRGQRLFLIKGNIEAAAPLVIWTETERTSWGEEPRSCDPPGGRRRHLLVQQWNLKEELLLLPPPWAQHEATCWLPAAVGPSCPLSLVPLTRLSGLWAQDWAVTSLHCSWLGTSRSEVTALGCRE